MYLWSFLTYGFLGYLLEKVYALVTRSRHTVRKGYLLLPVCPVYGLAMLAVLALPPDMTDTFWRLALYGGLTATAVEYAVHFCCDRLLGVMFWDYSSTKMDLNRRVCLPFALIWGPLAAMTARYLHPLLRPWLTAVPPWLTLAVWLLLTPTASSPSVCCFNITTSICWAGKTSCTAASPPDLSVHKSFTRCRSICS